MVFGGRRRINDGGCLVSRENTWKRSSQTDAVDGCKIKKQDSGVIGAEDEAEEQRFANTLPCVVLCTAC